MATILCSYSGITFNCEHFPITLDAGDFCHPVFAVPQKKLWKYFHKWMHRELTSTDSYLLFLAILRSTDLIEWRTPCRRTHNTDLIVSKQMERAFITVSKLNVIAHPKFNPCRFVISPETANLENIPFWLELWEENYKDFMDGMKREEMRSKIQKKEAALQRFIRNPNIAPEKYAPLLAEWAAEAAEFPVGLIPFWKDIIIRCHDQISLLSIEKKDLVELIEHCEEYLGAGMGTIYSNKLFTCLNEALTTIDGFFSIGSTTFQLLDNPTEAHAVEKANIANLVATAPIAEPRRMDYPTEFAFMKAKMRWNLSQNSAQNQNQNQGGEI